MTPDLADALGRIVGPRWVRHRAAELATYAADGLPTHESVPGIVVLLSREFTRWVLLANLIAWPAAFLVGKKWLENFAVRMPMPWELFLLASVLALAVAGLTVSYQSLRAATANPVDSLRYE